MILKSSLLGALVLVSCSLMANSQPMGRIVGGKDAEIGQFPYQVAIFENGDYNCGGSIIGSRYVLTAAHCVLNNGKLIPPGSLTLRVGSIKRMVGGKLVGVKRVIPHEKYGNFLNDVALLELKSNLKFNDNIQKIELFDGEVPSNASVIVSGWGRLYYGGGNPNNLQYNVVTKMDAKECDKVIGYGNDEVICLAHKEKNGTCNGDSGGPATYKHKLVGVCNFGQDGCGSKKPDVFAKVSYYRPWILKHMT